MSLCLPVFLMGCTLHTPKTAATPPPSKPAVVQPPPMPQLSLPQTAVVLPSPQPVNTAGIPVAPAPAPVPPEKTPATPTPPKVRPANTNTKAQPEQEPEVEPAPPAPAQEQPQFQPLLSAEEKRRIKGEIDTNLKQVSDLLARAKGHQTSENQTLRDRIDSFVNQSKAAEEHGDYTQADALSVRALILAKELQVE